MPDQTIQLHQGGFIYEAPLGPDGKPDLTKVRPVGPEGATDAPQQSSGNSTSNQPTQSWSDRALSGLRSLGRAAMNPANRPTLGALAGSAMTAGPAVALAPETGGLSLLLPTLGAMVGGGAGEVSGQMAQGKVDPAAVGQAALHQGEQQLAVGEIPAGVLTHAAPLAEQLGMSGLTSALKKVLTGTKGEAELNQVRSPSGQPVMPDANAARARLAEIVRPYGKIGTSDAAQGAINAADVAKANNLASAPKDAQGNPLLGFLPGGALRNQQTAEQAARVLGAATNASKLNAPVLDPRLLLYLFGGRGVPGMEGARAAVNIPRLINNPTTTQMMLDASKALPATGAAVRTFSPNLQRILDTLQQGGGQ